MGLLQNNVLWHMQNHAKRDILVLEVKYHKKQHLTLRGRFT